MSAPEEATSAPKGFLAALCAIRFHMALMLGAALVVIIYWDTNRIGAVAAAPPIGLIAGGIVLAVVAAGPAARFIALASRGVLYARLLRTVITLLKARPAPP